MTGPAHPALATLGLATELGGLLLLVLALLTVCWRAPRGSRPPASTATPAPVAA